MSDKKYSVYKHTSPEGKIYIGCTGDDPKARWKKGYHHNEDLSRDIENIGWDNFKHDILASNMNEDDAYELEKELIHKYKSNNPKYGYNKSVGGKINSGMVRSNVYRDKMSKSLSGKRHPMYGKHHSEESKRKMSISSSGKNHPMYGKHLNDDTKKKLSEAHKKENLSDETLRKMREARLGKHLSKDVIDKLSKSNSRKVICLETKRVYDSVKKAALDVCCNPTNISAACNGRLKTCAGYHWMHADEIKENED